MPTYEFRCPNGHEFEKFYRSIGSAEAQVACPVCGEIAERLMSAAGFAFKGSGFYLTDYGKNAHRDKGTEPRKPSSDSGASSDAGRSDGASGESGKTESKGDAKSDAPKSAGSTDGASAKSEPKAAEKKPAAEPKKSAGE